MTADQPLPSAPHIHEPDGEAGVTIKLLVREDGGLRVCSDDVPGLILSGPDQAVVLGDVLPALRVLMPSLFGPLAAPPMTPTAPLVLVPAYPTDEMLKAGAAWTEYQPEDNDGLAPNADMHCAKRVYQAMLAAAPTAPPALSQWADGWNFDMEAAPKDRRILVWTPVFTEMFVGAKWNDDRYAKKPRPYWELDTKYAGFAAMREKPPVAWTMIPSPPAGETP